MLRVNRSGCVVLLLALVSCTKPQDYYDVFREQRSTYQELGDILATIQDEKSMVAAKSKLEERFERFDATARKADALPKPPPPVFPPPLPPPHQLLHPPQPLHGGEDCHTPARC